MTEVEFSDEITCELISHNCSDLAVVNAARVSFLGESSEMGEKEIGIINFLMKNRHGTPFEHGSMTFRVEAPIVVSREHFRHRIGHSYNEMSGRYTQYKPKFYLPTEIRSQIGKPGAYEFTAITRDSEVFYDAQFEYKLIMQQSWAAYEKLLQLGVAKEMARGLLPVYIYTAYYWTCNPRSLMHFLGLRESPQAMHEIRLVARQAALAFRDLMPITNRAFRENGDVSP